MIDTIHPATRLADWNADANDLWIVTAIVQPFRLDAITLALEGVSGCSGISVSDCRGFGRTKLSRDRQHTLAPELMASSGREPAANARDVADYTRHLRVDCIVAQHGNALDVARTIAFVAHTGNEGDGKVFVARAGGVISIRTFDVDDEAV